MIQAYLVCYYERTIKEADALPLEDILKYRMEENYKTAKSNSEDELSITLQEMKEFYQDGVNMITEFKKRKSGYFPKHDFFYWKSRKSHLSIQSYWNRY